MRMPTLLSDARPRNLFRIAGCADPGSARVVVLLLVLWASMGASGVTAESVGPSAAPAQSAGAGDDAGDDPEDTGLPLEVDRLVPLDMTEGSWISLDVSPDGETIVFDFLGDLFTIPIAGGDATQLTSGMAFDAQPRFSPDGSRIVYTSDADGGQNVWVMDSDGSDPVPISKGASNRAESPEWMPDGDYVVAAMGAFRLSGLPKLKLFHVDGGSGVELISEPDNLKTLGPAVSPDGRYIWYSRRTGDWQYNAQLPQYQLEAYDVETGERYPRSSRYGSALRPTLSPDGRWLVFGTRHDEHTGLVLRDLEAPAGCAYQRALWRHAIDFNETGKVRKITESHEDQMSVRVREMQDAGGTAGGGCAGHEAPARPSTSSTPVALLRKDGRTLVPAQPRG